MAENRVLTGKVLEFFKQNSKIKSLIVDYVLDNLKNGEKSVALCFRGNFATLYYRCHQLLRIRNSRRGIIGEFDFRHARFTEDYRERLAGLKSMGVDISNFSDKPSEQDKRYVRFALDNFGEEKLGAVLEIYKELIDDFVNDKKCVYAFDPKASCRKSRNTEKNSQQLLYASHFLNGDLTYYDLEYAEPRGKEKGDLHGRFDLLGLRREKDGYTLLLTELKSSNRAIGGNSGLKQHKNDYLKYLKSTYMEARKKEAVQTVRLINEIFNRSTFDGLTEESIKYAKVKFIFSDEVINFGKSYLPSDGNIEKVYLEDGLEKPY